MRRNKKLLLGLASLPIALLIAVYNLPYWEIRSGTRQCLDCLQETQMSAYRIFGIPIGWKNQLLEEVPVRIGGGYQDYVLIEPEKTYAEIYGQPCPHLHRYGDARPNRETWSLFGGYGAACGGNGYLMQYAIRTAAMKSVYVAYSRIADRELAAESLALIETAYPDPQTEYPRFPPRDKISATAQSLYDFRNNLLGISTAADWRDLNTSFTLRLQSLESNADESVQGMPVDRIMRAENSRDLFISKVFRSFRGS